MTEATASAPTPVASFALDAQTPTPIAQLTPELPDRDSRVIDGVVTITWPYSIVTRSAAFILADHDFRLRHARGQLRLEFNGHIGQKLADAGVGGGDSLRISLEGAEWEPHKSQTRVPGTILEWQLKFTNRLLMRVQRADDQRLEILDLNLPDDTNGDDAPPATHTPQRSSPLTHSGLFATEVVATPGAHSPDRNLPTKRLASHAFEPAEYASPAFLKRARVSYGSLFEDGFDIFDEDVAKKKTKTKKTKRTRFSMGATGWKYSSRSPSPEPQAPKTHELETDSEEENGIAEPVEAVAIPTNSPTMVDEASQTGDTSFASQVAEQARQSASLIPSSPTPMTFGKPEEKPNGFFAAPNFSAPPTTKEEAVSTINQPTRPLFSGAANIFTSAATTTPDRSGILEPSFGNSGFSVEHTTTASTSTIPVFNDALAESIQSREAAEERVPGQPEPAFDVSTDEDYHGIVTGFDLVAGQEAHHETNPFAAPELPLPASIRNPFAVEPFAQAALSTQSHAEDEIYEANAYPEIQGDEEKPKESDPHSPSVSRSLDEAQNDARSQSSREEEEDEDQDESTDYEIEAGEPPQRLQQVESEEEEDEEEDEDQDVEQEEYGEDGEGYDEDEDESGFNQDYEEDEGEHYDDEDEDEDEDEDSEADEPAPQARQVSQDPVYISLLSDSEGEDEPAAQPSALVATSTDASKSVEDKQPDETENVYKADVKEDESSRQQPAEESDARESSPKEEAVQRGAVNRVSEDAPADEHYEEASLAKEATEEDPSSAGREGREGPVATEPAVLPAEVAQAAEPAVSPAEVVEPTEEEPEAADEMDVDEDDDAVSLIRMVEPDRPLEEVASPVPSPIAVDEDTEDVDAMEEDAASAQLGVGDANEKASDGNVDMEVTDALEEADYEMKSQPDIDMDIKEPEEVEMFTQGSPEAMVEDMPPEQVERETEVKPSAVALEEATQVTEEATRVAEEAAEAIAKDVEQVTVSEALVPAEDEPSEEDDARQLAAEAEDAANTRTTRNRQLPKPIDTQIPVTEAADIEIIQAAQDQPEQNAEEADEDDMAASQQIMGEFLQHASPKQELPPPPLPASAKEHRRKRSDTISSETSRRTRSQTKQHPDEEHEPDAAPPTSSPSPHSHRRSSRSIDKSNDATVVASIEPNTSMSSKSSDRTPLLQRSFRVTRSRGAVDHHQADPSVAIAKVTTRAAAGASSASPRSSEHTPSRPIMLRVTRSMESIAEAGLKEGLIIPEASVRSARHDDASSSGGPRSPARSTPLTPSTQMQLQLQKEHRPSESPALPSPSIATSPPAADPTTATPTTTVSELKMQLQRDLRTTLPGNLPLRSLQTSLHSTTDMIAVAAATPAPARRPRNGPRDYMLELLLVDPSSAPRGVFVAHIFRPHRQSLPDVRRGDVVLLRGMTVVAVKGRGFGLRVGDASAWAVFDAAAREAGEPLLPQINGPPLEVTDAEARYAMGLARWWALLDEPTVTKMERATQRMVALS